DLKADHRDSQAQAYFDKAYRLQVEKLSMRLKAAETLNNIAWLCARTGEHKDEAIAFANRAMALEPENYAYIDTAASAYFAGGDPKRAVALEKRALNMRPRDAFMQKQLDTFNKGTKD